MPDFRLTAFEDLSEGDIGRWRELSSRAVEPNPFFEPEYALALARAGGQASDAALAIAGNGTRWDACLPVELLPRWHRLPLPSLSTWRGHTLYSLLGTPLVAEDRLEAGARSLVAGLTRAPGSLFTGLDWLVEAGSVADALTDAIAGEGARAVPLESFQRAFLQRRPENTYLEEALSPKHRRELRRQRRKLGEELDGEPEVIDRAGDEAAVTQLIELEGRSRLAERGSVLASSEVHARFFQEFCRDFAAQGRLQLLELRAGGHTLALKCNIRAGEGLFYFKIAYDEDFARFSPGIQLELETMRIFHDETDAQWIDSCADANNAMINRLWPDRRILLTFAVARGARGMLVRPAVGTLRAVRNRTLGGDDR